MINLTGGEKYIVKDIVVKINKMYPSISEITSKEGFETKNSNLDQLYKYTLDIFIMLSKMTINMIDSSSLIQEVFNDLQSIHYYKGVNSTNKQLIAKVSKQIPQLLDELIKMVEDDTTARDSALKQIMEELGIVDPNAKKKKNFWD